MIRKAFVMSVHPDCVDIYQQRHAPIWPELEATLKEHGVRNYSIFLHSETHQLFAYAEIESDAQWASIASTEICQRWWESMKDLMAVNADNSPVSASLSEVFHLS